MRRIPKELRTIAWFCMFMGFALTASTIFLAPVSSESRAVVSPSDLPPYSWPTSLYKFEQGLTKYKESDAISKTVLIGASYVMLLPDIPGTFNFGVGTSKFSEHLSIINKYCDSDDKVLYFFSIYEPIYYADPPRFSLINTSLRRAAILKGVVDFRFPITRERMQRHPPSSFNEGYINGQINLFSKPDTYSIEPLYDIRRSHPNTVFILHPILPLSAFPNTPEAKRLKGAIRTLQSDCAKSDLSIIDLSDAMPREMFCDLFHLTDEGKSILISLLEPIINNQST